MDRINKIFNNNKYQDYYSRIKNCEKDRIYCHHDIDHFIDVARIAVMISEEENIEVNREYVYSAALLHDIGRFVQYETGKKHEIASAELSADILRESDFSEEESNLIITAIREHGNEKIKDERNLTGIIYRADKLSRKCYACNARATCHKKTDKMNLFIKI